MNRLERYEAIIDTEYYLYGGVVDVPKIYDADSKHHSERYVKGTSARAERASHHPNARLIGTIDFTEIQWLVDL
ncbi:hypothetical protein ABID74_003233 [Gordonia terrae]